MFGTGRRARNATIAGPDSPALPDALRARLFAHSVMDRVWSGAPLDVSEGDATRALAEARRVDDQLAEFYSVMAQQRIAAERGHRVGLP